MSVLRVCVCVCARECVFVQADKCDALWWCGSPVLMPTACASVNAIGTHQSTARYMSECTATHGTTHSLYVSFGFHLHTFTRACTHTRTSSSQALAEMKEKIKILLNEVEILRNESLARDRALTEEIRIHQSTQNKLGMHLSVSMCVCGTVCESTECASM